MVALFLEHKTLSSLNRELNEVSKFSTDIAYWSCLYQIANRIEKKEPVNTKFGKVVSYLKACLDYCEDMTNIR